MTQLQQGVCHTDDFAKHKHAYQILSQARMGVGRVIFPAKGPMRGQYILIMAKSQSVYTFYFYIYYSRDSYFLEMVMLISLEGSLTQTKMGVGRVTLPSKGPARSQYICLMGKSQSFVGFLFLINISGESVSISLK